MLNKRSNEWKKIAFLGCTFLTVMQCTTPAYANDIITIDLPPIIDIPPPPPSVGRPPPAVGNPPPPVNPVSIPEPNNVVGILVFGAFGATVVRSRQIKKL